jgi:uncharacterized phage protein (TIGR02218 family)
VKDIPTGLMDHYQLGTTTLATAINIVRDDAAIYGFTEHDVDDEIDGVTYLADPGLTLTELVIASGLQVGNMEITTLHDGTMFTAVDIHNGVWRNASFLIFRYCHQNIGLGIDALLAGNIGEIQVRQNTVVAELLDLRQYMQTPVGSASSKTCRYRLGSMTRATGGLCMIDLDSSTSPWREPFTVTNVTSNQVFRDSARAEVADFFGYGEVQWLTGNNAGVRRKVQAYAANGTFTLSQMMFGTVQVGDTGIAVAGCRGRLTEDCIGKFDNVLNFGGEPHRVGPDDLTKPAEANV